MQCKKWSHCLQYWPRKFLLILYTNWNRTLIVLECRYFSEESGKNSQDSFRNARTLAWDSSCSPPAAIRSSQLLWKASPAKQQIHITSDYFTNSAVTFLVLWLSLFLINPRLKGKSSFKNWVNVDISYSFLFFFSLLAFPYSPVLTGSFQSCQCSPWLFITDKVTSSIHLAGMSSPPQQLTSNVGFQYIPKIKWVFFYYQRLSLGTVLCVTR